MTRQTSVEMSARRREVELGVARGRRLLVDLCRELDEGLHHAGLSYAAVGRAVGLSGDQVARICRGEVASVGVVQLSTLFACIGQDLRARAYPAGDPIRDAPQVALLQRFRKVIGVPLPMRYEVPVVDGTLLARSAGTIDRRAWDGVLTVAGGLVGVEAETRVNDVQALLRKLELKRRDGSIDRLILLVNATNHNRRVLAGTAAALRAQFPGSARLTLRLLRAGSLPREDTLLVL